MAARDLLGHGPDHGPSPFVAQPLFREAPAACVPRRRVRWFASGRGHPEED